jgi:hypothetical protein
MPFYKCDKCNKIFTRKSGYASHVTRIKSCIKDNNDNNECIYCSKSYSTRFNLNAHIKICKEKPIIDETQSQIEELKKMFERKFEEQQKKLEEQQKKIDQLSKEKNNNITITENSHNTTTNNNIINIYNIGKEDLSLLAKEDVIKICTSGTYYPLVTANILHCNEKYPEFQNILISNLRSNTGLVKINDNWVSKSHDEIFRTLLKVDKNHVSSLMKDLEVDKKLQVKLESTKDEIDISESKEHQIPKIKECLYNASKMITKNKKLSDKN